MKTFNLKPATWALLIITGLFIMGALMSGCAAEPVIKVDKMAFCDDGLDAKLLSEPCAKSTALPAGSAYQDGLNANRTGNSALTSCGEKVDKLQQAMKSCHTAVVNHNAVIDAIAADPKK